MSFYELIKRYRQLQLLERREKVTVVTHGVTQKNTVVHFTTPQNNTSMKQLNKLTAKAEHQINKALLHIFKRYFADYRRTSRVNTLHYSLPKKLLKLILNFGHSVWQRFLHPTVLQHWLHYIFTGKIS